jgi:hypothetical protein
LLVALDGLDEAPYRVSRLAKTGVTDPRHRGDDVSALRGEAESRIEVERLDPCGTRTSCHKPLANRFQPR